MIDDEKLQELLTKASSLYHNGQYRDAIGAWQAALALDPSNQKATEGVRMATLLLGDWEPTVPSPEEGPPSPSDGAGPAAEGLDGAEAEAEIDLGIARVRQLVAERKYEVAIDEARALQAHSRNHEEIQRLLEEVQHGLESEPFVKEHLTLARELLDQERYAEAETECKKVFVLDREHPEAQALLGEIRTRIQQSLQRAAQQLGGMTVKLNLDDVRPPAPAAPPATGSAAAPSAGDPDSVFEVAEGIRPPTPAAGPPGSPSTPGAGGTAPSGQQAFSGMAEFDLPAGDGEAAQSQEEVASRNLLDQAFADLGGGATPPSADLPGEAFETPRPEPQEVVEAETVVPPSVRIVPPAATQPPAPPAPAGATPATPPPGPRTKPSAAAGGPKTGPRKAADPTPPSSLERAGEGVASSWEDELSQLNLKEGEHGIMRGAVPKPSAAPSEPADMDLMSLLDDDHGLPAAGAKKPTGTTPARPDAAAGRAGMSSAPMATPSARTAAKTLAQRKAMTPRPTREVVVDEEPEERPAPGKARDRGRPAPPPPKPRSSAGKVIALVFVLLLVAGGAAGWFFVRPSISVASVRDMFGMSPPGGSAPAVPGADGPIPTPLGGPGRPQDDDDAASVASPGAPTVTAPETTGEPAPAAAGSPAAGAPSPPVAATPPPFAVSSGPIPRPATIRTLEPVKPPEQEKLSPQETRRRIATYMADGRRYVQAGRWREARARLTAVLALDPVNFEAKELLDKAQAKIDAEQKLQDEFDMTKRLYEEKDYENVLRLLYRLPRDKGLGDIDRYTRNSWYSWAVALIKAGNIREALVKLSEVLTLNPEDADALKLQDVAERYQNRAKDRAFYAFTDALKPRPMDAR